VQAKLNNSLDELIAVNEKAMERADLETQRFAERAKSYSIALLAMATAFVLIFSLLISRSITRPLVELADGLAQVKQQDHDYPQLPVTSQDEIGFLTSQFNHLFERLKEYDQINLEKLSAERAKVREAQEAKARFVADLSHQLKTPMTSLAMSVGILSEKARNTLAEKYVRLLETAREDCTRLSNLINELVNLSRMDAMIEPKPKELLDVKEMVNRCLKPLFLQAEEKGVNLVTSFQADLPLAYIDSFRFPWVITNLVGNAIRYTPAGGMIRLEVERRANSLLFTCRDTGVGIEPQYLARIFDRYAQFSERVAMGTIGLGLAIVKEIIEQHGGDIKVSSRPSRGTVFTFWIPLK
jgi:signal transduction histidine kinase